jgi:hypothetical protein
VPADTPGRSHRVIERAPRARCYKCGSADIHSLCHHCTRPMCEKHGSRAFRDATRPVGKALARAVRTVPAAAVLAGDDAKPVSREYANLKLEGIQAAVYHCEDHAHVVRGNLTSVMWAGAILATVGVITAFAAPLPGLVLLLAGIVAGSLAYGVGRARGETGRADQPRLPLFPHVSAVEVIERLHGTVRLSHRDEYVSAAEPVTGEITIKMTHSDWRNRLRLYRKKYRVPEDQPVKFAAGFAMLEGEAGLLFTGPQDAVLDSRLGLSFTGEGTDHDLFQDVTGQAEGTWNPAISYELQAARALEDMPLWIVPSLVPASDQRILEIDLHWNPLGTAKDPPELDLLRLVKIEVPAEWGHVERVSPDNAVIFSAVGGGTRVVEWRRLPPRDDVGRNRTKPTQGGRSRTLTIRFEKPIMSPSGGSEDSARRSRLSGTVQADFNRTLSGLTGVGLYLPGGGRDQQPETKLRTEVHVDFDISLGALRYQQHRVVPDDKIDTDPTMPRDSTVEFCNVIPDYHTVIDLVDALSADDFYVKSVVENPPKVENSQLNTLNRFWDITGRAYYGVFPIDFVINLRGDEVRGGGTGAYLGKTIAEVMVKGSYANEVMREQIEGKWDQLHAMVTDLLRSRMSPANGGLPIAAPGTGTVPDIAGEVVVAELADEPADSPRPASAYQAPPEPGPARAEQIAALYDRWDDADDALTSGRIGAQKHDEIVERIKKRLKDLGESV